jgi:cell pole-organizing protein PopZ
MRAGMKDLAGEPSSLYSQVAKYRFKNPGESSPAGVPIKVDSNTVSAGTLSSNVKNLEKASAAVESKGNEGQSTTSQDPAGTSSTENADKQQPLKTTDGGSEEQLETQSGTKEPDVPTEVQVDTSGQTEDPTKLSVTTKTAEENANTSETVGGAIGSSATSKDTAGTSGTSKDTSSPSPPQTLKTLGGSSKPSGTVGGVVAFFESVRANNARDNSGGNTTDPGSSNVTVTLTSETGTQDRPKVMTSDDEKSSEVVTSQEHKQSGMIYTMTR